jgi:hypothetical protein
MQGWRLVISLLTWLRDHNSPRSVSGTMHRLQLQLALRYMMVMTGQPGDQARKVRRGRLREGDGGLAWGEGWGGPGGGDN